MYGIPQARGRWVGIGFICGRYRVWLSWIYLYMKSFYGIVDLGSYLIGLLDDRDVSQNKKNPRQISHHSSQFQFQKFIVTKKFHRGFQDIYDGYLFT